MTKLAAPSMHAPRDSTLGGAPHVRHGRGPRSFGTWVLVVAALLGAVIGLASLAPLFGHQFVRLATGSMSPGYPAGSVLLVRDVAAQSVTPGDIVTVMRADGSPVTHRVVAIENAGAGAIIRMKGDANVTEDPTPYVVTRVGKVVAGVPTGGAAFDVAEHPAFVPIVAGAVSVLVLWAWWPAKRRPSHRMPAPVRGAR